MGIKKEVKKRLNNLRPHPHQGGEWEEEKNDGRMMGEEGSKTTKFP